MKKNIKKWMKTALFTAGETLAAIDRITPEKGIGMIED